MVMNNAPRVVVGLISCALGAVFIYSLLALVYILTEEGLVNRMSLLMRNTSIAIVAATISWFLLKGIVSRGGVRGWLFFFLIAAASSLLLFYGYGFLYHMKMREGHWRDLQEFAKELGSRDGIVVADLLRPSSHYVIVLRPMNDGREQLHITVNSAPSGWIFGVDVFQFDVIVVDVGLDGQVEGVRIDYF